MNSSECDLALRDKIFPGSSTKLVYDIISRDPESPGPSLEYMDDDKELGSDYFLIAHIDLEQVSFGRSTELRFNYVHISDGWDKISQNFQGRRNQRLKALKKAKRAKSKSKKST